MGFLPAASNMYYGDLFDYPYQREYNFLKNNYFYIVSFVIIVIVLSFIRKTMNIIGEKYHYSKIEADTASALPE